MNFQDKPFVSGRIKSIKYALLGAYKLITTEHSIMTQLGFGLVMTALGFYKNLSTTEWILQTMSIGMILAIESLNTAVEKIADFIHPEYHKKIGFIKDVAAGAVTFVAFTGFIVAAIIYIPKFI